MPIYKVPSSVSHVTTASRHVFEVVDGFVDTQDAPGIAVDQFLQAVPEAVLATDEHIQAADTATVMEPVTQHIARQKSDLVAQLKDLGIVVDARTSLKNLVKMLDDAHKEASEKAAEKAAEDAGSETPPA